MTTILIGLILSAVEVPQNPTISFRWAGVVPTLSSELERPIIVNRNTPYQLLKQRSDMHINKHLSKQYSNEQTQVIIFSGNF